MRLCEFHGAIQASVAAFCFEHPCAIVVPSTFPVRYNVFANVPETFEPHFILRHFCRCSAPTPDGEWMPTRLVIALKQDCKGLAVPYCLRSVPINQWSSTTRFIQEACFWMVSHKCRQPYIFGRLNVQIMPFRSLVNRKPFIQSHRARRPPSREVHNRSAFEKVKSRVCRLRRKEIAIMISIV